MTTVPFDLFQLIALQVISALAAGWVAFKSKTIWVALGLAVVASFVSSFVIGFIVGFLRAAMGT